MYANQTTVSQPQQQLNTDQTTIETALEHSSVSVTKSPESIIQPRDLKLKHTDLKSRVLRAIKAGKPFKLNRTDVRKLMVELRHANPQAYEQAKIMNLNQRRKLFMGPIFEALGLGELSEKLGPLGSTLLGVGTVAAGVGVGAIAGRMGQSNTIDELNREKNKIESSLMMIRTQAENNRSKLEFKLGELETQISDLSETSESGVNLLNLWVDSHVLI